MSRFIDFFKRLFYKKEKPAETDWRDGLVPSPLDFRDVQAKDILGAPSRELTPLPEEYRSPYILTIKDQDNKPHCVGYATASLKEMKERQEQNFIEFDGDWIYNECKKIDGLPNITGTFYRAGLKVLINKGTKPIGGNEVEAEKYRIGGYIGVENDFNALKRAIYEFGGVLVGYRWTQEGWKTAYIKPPRAGEKEYGHAVLLVGYNKDYLIGQNSFGLDWADKGYFYIPKDYPCIEAWAVLVDLPNNWKELLGPATDKPKHFFENNLFRGLRNDEVKILQDCLKFLGCLPKEQESTGYFGDITLQSVKIFQQRYGIEPVSGYVGPLTRAKLNEFFAY
jgi:hypothetical protein